MWQSRAVSLCIIGVFCNGNFKRQAQGEVDFAVKRICVYDTIKMVSNKMNSKHRKTLKALFENPVRSNIVWGDIEKLFVGLEATILEGTRVRGSVFS